MTRVTRISIAVVLVAILALTAGGVWASQKFAGTVPPVPGEGKGKCPNTVDMGTALFTPQGNTCDITVGRIGPDTGELAGPPEGLASVSDVFQVTINPADVLVKVCYAYPPELANKNAKIYRLNEDANPAVWVEVPGGEAKDGAMCVTTKAGYVALFGKK